MLDEKLKLVRLKVHESKTLSRINKTNAYKISISFIIYYGNFLNISDSLADQEKKFYNLSSYPTRMTAH